MPERNPNLLLSDAAAPAAGIGPNVLRWHGGPFQVTSSGVYDGATFELLISTKFPASGDVEDFDEDHWAPLATSDEPGVYTLDNLNPCAVTVRTATPGANTRVRILLG